MIALKNILTIARREVTRLRTRFTGKSRLVILFAVLLCLLVSFILYRQDFSLSKGLYTVGVAPDGPIISDSRFNTLTLDYPTGRMMLAGGAIDAYVDSSQVYFTRDERSLYTVGALKQYFRQAELSRITAEYPLEQAFPLRIEVDSLPAPESGISISLEDLITSLETAPSAEEQPGEDIFTGQTPLPPAQSSATDQAVRDQLDRADEKGKLPEFKGEFVSDNEIIVPSLMDPPMPLAQVTMAFLYVVPIFFISVFFTSSFIEEKTGRKLTILLSAPVTQFQIIAGKMLPYIVYSIAAIIAITLLLRGNVLLALAIFIPVMLFILSVYLMVALNYRTFRDQTFFSVLAVAVITAYLVAPAMFAGVSDLSYISPLTLAVDMYKGESFGLLHYFLSTLPMYLIFAIALFAGQRMFNEEYMSAFKPLYLKFADAVYLIMDKKHLIPSVFIISLLLIPVVFMVQLGFIVIATNLPRAVIFIFILLFGVIIEEIAKSVSIAVILRHHLVRGLPSVILLAGISALGFFVGEKLLLFLATPVVGESMITRAVFTSGLLIFPLLVHFISTALVSIIMMRFGTGRYLIAVLAGALVHGIYNLFVIGALS